MTDDPKIPKPDGPDDPDAAWDTVGPSKPALPKMPALPRPVLPRPDGGAASRKLTPRALSLPMPRSASRSSEHAVHPPQQAEALQAPPAMPASQPPESAAPTAPPPAPLSEAKSVAPESSLASLLAETLSLPPPAPPSDADVSLLLSHFAPKSSQPERDEPRTPLTPLPPTVRGGSAGGTPFQVIRGQKEAAAEPDDDGLELPDLILNVLDDERPVEERTEERTPTEADVDADDLGVEEMESASPTRPPASGAGVDTDEFALDVLGLAPGNAGHDADEIDGERVGVTLATVPAPARQTPRPTARPDAGAGAGAPSVQDAEIATAEIDRSLLGADLNLGRFAADISTEEIDASELEADLASEEAHAPMPGDGVAAQEPDRDAVGLDASEDELDRPTFVPEGAVPVAEVRKPPSLVPPSLDDERPAAAALGELGLSRAWYLRAERIEAAANASNDVSAKGRGLLVASELWAMVGELERSRAAARKASQASPGVALIQRQSRMLAALEADWKVAGAQLDAESRSAPTPEARAHAAYMSAEIRRLAMNDAENARRRMELERRVWPGDPRPVLLKLAADLGSRSPAIPSTADLGEDLAMLEPAARIVARMGGAPDASGDPHNPALAFLGADQHLKSGNVAAALDALEPLESVKGLADAVSWLVAALAAPLASQRPRAVRALRRLLKSTPDGAVRRALAARALELGDAEALSEALAAEDSTFTTTDRIALGSLTGAGAALSGAIADLATAPEGRPLATAAARAIAFDVSLSTGEAPARTADVLGRRLMSNKALAAASGPLDDFATAHAGSAIIDLLSLEKDRAAGAFLSVAERLAQWDDDGDGGATPFVAGLLSERAGGSAEAAAHYLAALEYPTFGEAAARALGSLNPGGTAAFLRKAAEALEPGAEARGLLLYEVALRLAAEDPAAALELTRAAAEAAPRVAPIHRLGDQLSRVTGNPDEIVRWLAQRQAIADDPIERALDAVREALLVADTNAPRAALLLDQAADARPGDVALRELSERISDSASLDRGAWREAAAANQDGKEQSAALLVEAALEYERAGALEQAARVAGEAAERGGGAFARVTAERLAALGPQASVRSGELLRRARDTEDAAERTALYEELHRLDVAQGSAQTALMWHHAILERAPDHLASLRALEHAFIGEGRDDDLEPIETALTRLTDPKEGSAHGALAARIRSRTKGLVDRADLVRTVLERASTVAWATRDRVALAEVTTDTAALRQAYEALIARGGRPLDVAAACLRAAEATVTLGDVPAALVLLDRALDAAPDYMIARSARAELRERTGDLAGAADDFERVGEAGKSVATRVRAFERAGTLYLEHLSDLRRAASVLERAAALSPDDEGIFDRLQLVYVKTGGRAELANLLQRRLERTQDPEQRIALEVTRGRALTDVGDRKAAREALDAALEADPDHVDALEVYANLCTSEGDYPNAERAWIRLARVCAEPARQTQVYRQLGELYTEHVKNPQRAERCYREVLKRQPEDDVAATRLVAIYVELNDVENAARLQTELVERAESPEVKRDRLLKLSDVYERAGDKKSAATVLEKARKAWPQDDVVLRAAVTLHRQHGEAAAVKISLDRAANDARRGLTTGRFDTSFFATLLTVAELREAEDPARVAGATLAAIEGREETAMQGAGAAAADPRLDDLIAPEVLTAPLRSLLKKLAGVLDAAYPLDLRALKAAPPAAGNPFAQQIRQVAAKMGIQGVEVLVSPTLHATWLPASSTPPRLVAGQALLTAGDDAAQKFALFRALKILQSQGAALARLSPVELWPTVAALLATFARGWQPHGVDPERFSEAKARIEAARLPRVDDDVPILSLEVAGTIGARAGQIGTGFQELGSRAALLGMGSPSSALRALSLAAGPEHALPPSGPERLKWIARHDEARDLAVFSVSDAYAEARNMLGLSK